eukprot:TRINITY_DN14980_c0_g1_i1.p1 TRINITY_DN14980_c0_g1~~TRINITY_DN14980_c0_g1_i1.p1  ORF type:complete len:1119 (+),score=240.91 TRINITY_DN14980_c0_g1_i1:87-3443(+)
MAETIKVAVRVRPLLQRELDSGASLAVAVHQNAVTVNTGSQQKTFGFDHAYWSVDPKDVSYASQDQLNSDVGRPCLENMLKGYNFCVFAYGQTGAGKTHTLSSTPRDKQMGLIPFVLEGLFTQHRAKFKNDELRIWISFMEIYNEQIRDLLNPGRETIDLKVMDHPELGAYVPGLTEAPCREMTDVKKLLDFGTKKRVTAATNMNSGSSRSHAVFTIRAQRLTGPKPAANKPDNRKSLSSRVNMIDLAGSERIARSGAEGLRLREGCAINQSLTALGLVIKQIGEAQREGRRRRFGADERTKAIPFRASKLTFLLRESLAGNSKTFMIAAISPASSSAEETVSTLRFASSVKRVKTVAMQNVDKKDEIVASLQAEATRLAELLDSIGPEGAGDAVVMDLHEDIAERERLLAELTKSHGQQLAEARLLQAMREEVFKDMGLTQQDLAQTIGIDKDVPYLMNMNEDPALAGKMMYFLLPGQPITVGTDKENKVVLQGLGMPDRLCQIDNLEDQGVVVTSCTQQAGLGMTARVCINGSVMKESERRKLKHNDKIFLGRTFALRLVVPEAARALGQAGAVLPECEQDLELLRAIVPQDSKAWSELQLYLEDLRHRLGDASGNEIFQTLIETSNLVDEANEITTALRPEDQLKFEVELVWDIHRAARDIIIIRLMKAQDAILEEDRSPCSQASDLDRSVVVAYWTLTKFKARLDQMRDCFDEKQNLGRWEGRGDCLRDPWMEPSITELRHRLVAHIDKESQRRSIGGSLASIRAVAPGSRHGIRGSLVMSPSRVFGLSSKVSVVSAESGSNNGSPNSSKVLSSPPHVPRQLGSSHARRPGGPLVTRIAPSSGGARPRPKAQPESSAVSSQKPEGLHRAQAVSSAASMPGSASRAALKDELNDAMRAQLQEKSEKEELYQLRIEYLQQQIDLYRQYVGNSGLPTLSSVGPPQAKARARSSSPGMEPRTLDAGSTMASVAVSVPARQQLRSCETGNGSLVRALSAREVRTLRRPSVESVSPRPQAVVAKEMPSLLTSVGLVVSHASPPPDIGKASLQRLTMQQNVPAQAEPSVVSISRPGATITPRAGTPVPAQATSVLIRPPARGGLTFQMNHAPISPMPVATR